MKIVIPESLEDMTLGQMMRFYASEQTDANLIECFCNLNKEAVSHIRNKDFTEIAAHIKTALNTEPRFTRKFKLEGKEFGFIPSLDDISYGENVDINKYIQDWKTMDRAMAVLYRPITAKLKNKYLIEEYEGSSKYKDVLKDMPLSEVIGAHVFFYSLAKDLLSSIPTILQAEVNPQRSEAIGEHIRNYTSSLRAILEDLERLVPCHYTSALCI